jgi:16S rRNA (guanine527-N7)-methyltransferase
MTSPTTGGLSEPVPAVAAALFGERLSLVERYARMLATDGVVRGLIGPREGPRIWQRHLLNSAVVAELVPPGVSVTDVGSGAGLPGIVLALARPDLQVTLVEPMARRTTFLTEAVTALSIGERVRVVRARAEECHGRLPDAEVVTARALAPLDRLARWCLPLAVIGGKVLAVKGASAVDEVGTHAAVIRRLGGGPPVVRKCGIGLVEPATTVIEIVRERASRRRP